MICLGPLITKEPPNYKYHSVIGVGSWGEDCSNPDYPLVYARVTHVLPWIKMNIKGKTCKPPGWNCANHPSSFTLTLNSVSFNELVKSCAFKIINNETWNSYIFAILERLKKQAQNSCKGAEDYTKSRFLNEILK